MEALEHEGFTSHNRPARPALRRGVAEGACRFHSGRRYGDCAGEPCLLASKACNWELGQVKATNKRLVPVVIEPVATDGPARELSATSTFCPPSGAFDFEFHLKALAMR